MMPSVAIIKAEKELQLQFIPEVYRAEFIIAVLRHYAVACEFQTRDNHRLIPDVSEDIAMISTSFFLFGALAAEDGDPYAFQKRIEQLEEGSERSEDIFLEALDEMYEEFSQQYYASYHHDFIDDIAGVLHSYHMSYKTMLRDPFSFTTYYDIENYAVIEIW